MKKSLFYAGLGLLVLFELANIWFIMPLPGSQRMDSVGFAYTLYRGRWVFRVAFGALIVAGALPAFGARGWRKVFPALATLVVAGIVYLANFEMAADHMFLMPRQVTMQPLAGNRVEPRRLVVGVAVNGEARAYPLQFIGYHHQVQDSVGGVPVLVTYCTVCRTGRVFDPVIDGREETFRLVGMDHFNAMLEDRRTGSWWRQATGQAVTGSMRGKQLREIPSQQLPLAQWLALHPNSLVMQPDSAFSSRYPRTYAYESGESRSSLTGTDTIPWSEKAWVVGVKRNGASRAYDWQRLKRERVVNDTLGGQAIVIQMAPDSVGFLAFARDTAGVLRPIQASQEFWHSWRTFQPATTRY